MIVEIITLIINKNVKKVKIGNHQNNKLSAIM